MVDGHSLPVLFKVAQSCSKFVDCLVKGNHTAPHPSQTTMTDNDQPSSGHEPTVDEEDDEEEDDVGETGGEFDGS